MNKMIDFDKFGETSPAIIVERTEDFYIIARELNGFIKSLSISRPENDKLIDIIIRQVQAGEQGAFKQGLRMGKEFSEWQMGRPEA